MTVRYDEDGLRLYEGDALAVLRELPDASVQCCVTSPPYWGLRAYKAGEGEIGMEPTPDAYVERLVAVFREVRRVLRDDGTLWLNLGDAYCSMGGAGGTMSASGLVGGSKRGPRARPEAENPEAFGRWRRDWQGLKPKDLIGLPWMVAFALRADGWYLRSDIIWAKPNPMPESVTDRPTKAHEYVFLLSKSARYFFDQDAVREAFTEPARRYWEESAGGMPNPNRRDGGDHQGTRPQAARYRDRSNYRNGTDDPKLVHRGMKDVYPNEGGRNVRTVWTIATQPSPLPHFAAFPDELAERCIKAGCPAGGVVLDPFAGTGTTLKVARDLGRRGIGIDLSAEYCELARKRLAYGVRGVLAMQAGQEALL